MSKYGLGYNTLTQEELNDFFSRMCFYEDFNEVKYLLTSPELILRPNLHFKEDEAFKFLLDDENLEILKYLIIEHNMERTQDIIEIMEKNPSQFSKRINELFIARGLNEELERELSIDNKNKIVKKAKI